MAEKQYTEEEKRLMQEAKDAKDREKIKSMGFAKGGKVGSASKRADGCAVKGKTRGKMI